MTITPCTSRDLVGAHDHHSMHITWSSECPHHVALCTSHDLVSAHHHHVTPCTSHDVVSAYHHANHMILGMPIFDQVYLVGGDWGPLHYILIHTHHMICSGWRLITPCSGVLTTSSSTGNYVSTSSTGTNSEHVDPFTLRESTRLSKFR